MSSIFKFVCVLSEARLDSREVSFRTANLIVSEKRLKQAKIVNLRAHSIYGVPGDVPSGKFQVIYGLGRQTENGSWLFDFVDTESAEAIAEALEMTLAEIPTAPLLERDMSYRRASAPSRITLGSSASVPTASTEAPF